MGHRLGWSLLVGGIAFPIAFDGEFASAIQNLVGPNAFHPQGELNRGRFGRPDMSYLLAR
jgi:hypothetical protein